MIKLKKLTVLFACFATPLLASQKMTELILMKAIQNRMDRKRILYEGKTKFNFISPSTFLIFLEKNLPENFLKKIELNTIQCREFNNKDPLCLHFLCCGKFKNGKNLVLFCVLEFAGEKLKVCEFPPEKKEEDLTIITIFSKSKKLDLEKLQPRI